MLALVWWSMAQAARPREMTIQGNYSAPTLLARLPSATVRMECISSTVPPAICSVVRPPCGNVISGNTVDGVRVEGINNSIVGNIIGLNAAGNAKLANNYGIYINNVANNTIVAPRPQLVTSSRVIQTMDLHHGRIGDGQFDSW